MTSWRDKWGESHDIARVDQDYAERMLLHLIQTAPERERLRRESANPFVDLTDAVNDSEFCEIAVRRTLRTPTAKAILRRLGEFESTPLPDSSASRKHLDNT